MWTVCSERDEEEQVRTPGRGGGDGVTVSLKVGSHCQTTAPTFQGYPPLSFP